MNHLNDPVQWEQKLQRQEELEDDAVGRGRDRFKRRLRKARESGVLSTVGAAQRLLVHGIEPLERGIESYVLNAKTRKGPKPVSLKWIERVGTDVAAYLTLKVVLDQIETPRSVQKVAGGIAELIVDELRYRKFREEAPGLFDYKLSHFNTGSYAHMARSLNASMGFAKIDQSDLTISPTHRLFLGAQLLNILIETTQLVELVTETTKLVRGKKVVRRDKQTVRATADTIAWLSKKNATMELLTPVVLPMVVPPLQWEKGQRGGYRFAMRNKFSLMRGASAQHTTEAEHTEMPVVYQAVNAVQNTAWRINEYVYDVVQEIYERGGGMAGVAAFDEEPKPAKPQDIDTNEEARRAWRKAAHAVITRNVQRGVKALEFIRVLDIARLMHHEEAFFFPQNLDFRGRMYPIANYLSPQGDDLSRGLLTFAQGKPMEGEAARYLAQHGANCLDTTPEGLKLSKLTIQERVQWIEEHTAEIRQCAQSPMSVTWWMKAEEPFQFLAFCNEWDNWKEHGDGYVCSLPVAIDGSCNGLQHFSAMLKDEVGAKAVNVTPNEKPSDIYQIVADKVLDELQEIAVHGDTEAKQQMALKWLTSGLVSRKITKRPTMTFPYGSRQFGFQAQVLHFMQHNEPEKWNAIREHFGNREVQQAAEMLARCIWHAVIKTVGGAAEGMQWLQKVARAVAKTGKPLEWRVPSTGFPVKQEYFVMDKKQIQTILAGRLVQPVLYTATTEIEMYKQANAVAPNIVHSLDAAALMQTVKQAKDEGVESFAAVHDSYGTVPSDMAVLARSARMSFVKLYTTHNVIEELRTQFQQQAGEKALPAPPAHGALDVNAVLASEYFFA